MTGHRLGELFAGYNGLGLAIEKVFNATPAWFSEWEAAPSKILAHHYPHVPNYGDVTKINWYGIEQATIISGGSPCQDLSLAGHRKGMTDGTRSNLWQAMCDGIEIQRPEWVVWENVRGALSATANSDLEHCPGCMGNPTDCALRALGRVLGDLADIGYDCQWRGLRAADVGAPHGRFRVFLLAHRRDAPRTTPNPHSARREEQRGPVTIQPEHAAAQHPGTNAADHPGATRHGQEQQHIPAPAGPTAEPRKLTGPATADTEGQRRAEGRTEPTRQQRRPDPALGIGTDWGPYAPAIRRWERITGNPAPQPTEPTGRNDGYRLNPEFAEWMMGLEPGWIVDTPDITRNDQLKAAGNGVVPQQATAALKACLQGFRTQWDS